MSAPRRRLDAIAHHLNPVTVDPATDTVLAMEDERNKTAFDVRELTYFLDGGEKTTQLKERLMLSIERDPDMRNDDHYDLTKDEIRERTMKKFRNMAHYVTNDDEQTSFLRLALVSIVDPGFWTRFGVHYGLFFNALRGSANDNQMSYWLERGAASLNGIIGCFCMTELGHGSNVQALETTATFDEGTDEFIVHTPSLTATKWWIGGAAHSATHGVVFAQLIIKGKRYGVKSFVVPLRNPEDYSLKPGITIGDLGKKMGRDGIDNGYVQFSHVRIPRLYMLMKHTKVSREGKVKEPPIAQLTYGALITGRTAMVIDSSASSKRMTTIAIRYACVRRQFSANPGSPETKLIDYAMHQRRLMPLLAQTYAMQFAGDKLLKMYNECTKKLANAGGADEEATKEALDILKEMHATSAGLKAFCTWSALEAIDKCRQTCGGHGYSAYNGFGSAFADFAVHTTWEGDNTILALQAGRSLIASYKDAVKGVKLAAGVSYLNRKEDLKKASAGERAVTDFDVIKEAWQACAAVAVEKAALLFEDAVDKQGKTQDQAYEYTSQLRFLAAQVHTRGFLVTGFLETVEGAPESIQKILKPLALLYALWSIEENSGLFLQAQYFSSEQIDQIRVSVSDLCLEVRNQCIGLTDAFNMSDYFINAPIGTFDGNVYPKYFDRINKSSPPGQDHPYFEKIIKPLITRNMDEPDDIEEESEDEDEEEEDKDAGGNQYDEGRRRCLSAVCLSFRGLLISRFPALEEAVLFVRAEPVRAARRPTAPTDSSVARPFLPPASIPLVAFFCDLPVRLEAGTSSGAIAPVMSKVTASNVSLEVTSAQIKQFFSFCGRIEDISLVKGANYQTAVITFERASAAKTALLLQDAVLGMNKITITSEDKLDDDRELAEHEAGGELPQEHKPRSTIVAEILSHGYVLGDQAAQKSLEFDNSTGISATFKNFFSTVQKKTTELDQQYHVSEKVKEVDGKYKVSETTNSTAQGIQSSVTSFFSQVASHPIAQKAQSYLSAPLGSVTDIHAEARRMANERQGGTGDHRPGDVIHESGSTAGAGSGQQTTPSSANPPAPVTAESVPKLGSTA